MFLLFYYPPFPMDTQALKDLIKDGLAAHKAGSEVAAKATDEIKNAATNPELVALLTKSNETAKEWATRIDRAIAEAGGVEERPNEISEALDKVSKEIRDEAKTDDVRDLGIIASSQLALNYWIAAFGTTKAYAEAVGLTQTASDFQTSVEEAKKADEAHTALAQKLLAAK